MREFALELGLPADVRVLSRPETVVFMREHLFEFDLDEYRPLGDPTRFLDALATLFSRAKDEDVSPDAYVAHAVRLAADAAAASAAVQAQGDAATKAERDAAAALEEEARRQGELARAYARYQSLLAANGAIDFGDQVSLALRLLRGRPRPVRPCSVASGTCWWTSSRTRTGRRRSWSPSSRSATAT